MTENGSQRTCGWSGTPWYMHLLSLLWLFYWLVFAGWKRQHLSILGPVFAGLCQSLGLSVRGLFEGLSYRSACSRGDEGRGEMVDMFFALGKVTKRGYDCACKHVHVSLYDCVTVWLCQCVTAWLYYCMTVLLYDCVAGLMCDCVTGTNSGKAAGVAWKNLP